MEYQNLSDFDNAIGDVNELLTMAKRNLSRFVNVLSGQIVSTIDPIGKVSTFASMEGRESIVVRNLGRSRVLFRFRLKLPKIDDGLLNGQVIVVQDVVDFFSRPDLFRSFLNGGRCRLRLLIPVKSFIPYSRGGDRNDLVFSFIHHDLLLLKTMNLRLQSGDHGLSLGKKGDHFRVLDGHGILHCSISHVN